MSALAIIMAAVIFVPGSPHQGSRLPYKFRCEQVMENGETFLMCERYNPDHTRPLGPKPIYHCSFTVYSHIQMGFCKDGKGSWKSKLRGSGPHPRDARKVN